MATSRFIDYVKAYDCITRYASHTPAVSDVLEELGVISPWELQYLDHNYLPKLTNPLKPVQRNTFLGLMGIPSQAYSQYVTSQGNHSTSITKPIIPPDPSILEIDRPVYGKVKITLSQKKQPLPIGWREYIDKKTGKHFFRHFDTHEKTWRRPSSSSTAPIESYKDSLKVSKDLK